MRVVCVALWLLLAAMAAHAQKDHYVDLIHVSDTHVQNLAGVHPQMIEARKHYEPGAQTFPKFLEEVVVRQRPAFVVHTGDAIDASSFTTSEWGSVGGQVEFFSKIAKRSTVPLYLVLGNHDVVHYAVIEGRRGAVGDQSVAGRARAEWIRNMDCFREGTYYKFERMVGKTKYVFLMLDNGYQGDGDPEILAAGSKLSLEQTQWLKKQATLHRDDVVILGMHIPLSNSPTSQAIREALSACRRVPLVMAGHVHTEGFDDIAVGQGKTLQARLGAFGRDVNQWRLVRLREDRLEVFEAGKPESIARTIPLEP